LIIELIGARVLGTKARGSCMNQKVLNETRGDKEQFRAASPLAPRARAHEMCGIF
jgi:hypothetical protein